MTTSAEYPAQFRYAVSIFLLVENVFAFLVNICVLVVFHLDKKSLNIQGNAFIISLNILDILVCLTTVPMTTALLLTSRSQSKLFCYFHEASISFASSASAINLLVISLDRYDSVLYPLQRHITNQKIKYIIILIWIISWFGFCTPFYGYGFSEYENKSTYLPCAKWFHISRIHNYYYELYYVFIYIVSNAVMIVCYWQIFRQNRTRLHVRKAIVKLTLIRVDGHEQAARVRLENERKLTTVSLTIVVSFMFCWGPHAVLSVVLVCITDHTMTLEMLQLCFLSMAYFSGVLHPLLYAFIKKNVRDALSSHFRSRSGSKVVPLNSELLHRGSIPTVSMLTDAGPSQTRRGSLSSDFRMSVRSGRRASDIVHLCITRSRPPNKATLPDIDEKDEDLKSVMSFKPELDIRSESNKNLNSTTKEKPIPEINNDLEEVKPTIEKI